MTAADALDRAAGLLGDRARRDEPLGPLTTYRVGGRAALLVDAADEADLELVAAAVSRAEDELAVLVVGQGSNLLVADAGFPGLVVRLGDGFAHVAIEGATVVAGGAVKLPVLARRTAAAGLTGLEWAVGVPGSVGGAVRMNAGGHGAETRQSLVSARIADLRSGGPARVVALDELALGYRRSSVQPWHVVVSATFALAAGDAATSEAQLGEIVRWRRDNQPGGQNAGSVFTNPPGDSAGRVIDAAGLKGFRVGSAHVSTKHANFFQADEGGSADDVLALVQEVRRLVRERTGVDLVPELRLVGFGDGATRAE